MSVTKKLLEASGGGGEPTYVDDVFSTYLYEGDQTTSSTQIVNGIDLDDKGGLVWIKERSQDRFHFLYDTERGAGKWLNTNNADAEGTLSTEQLQSFNSDGFNLGDFYGVNETGEDFVSWSFAKQEGFFDVVTYTGDGVAGREIAHNLGSTPGMVIVKCINRDMNNRDWMVYHRSLNGGTTPENYFVRLNLTNAESTSTAAWDNTAPTAYAFTLGNSNDTNENGYEYVAYVFAHDVQEFGPDSDESIIKCGLLDASNYTVEEDLGWEPQWILMKSLDSGGDWTIVDNMRGSIDPQPLLYPNKPDAEVLSGAWVEFTPRGFKQNILAGTQQGIYMAIRRPNKPAKEFEPDELFGLTSATSNAPWFKAGFPVDMAWRRRYDITTEAQLSARLIDESYLKMNTTDAATSSANRAFDFSNGWYDFSSDASTTISWMFRRAPGFFDVATYEGNGVTGRQLPHGLGVKPDMIWVKGTSLSTCWSVWHEAYGTSNNMLQLDQNGGLSSYTSYFAENASTPPVVTDGTFSVNANGWINGSGHDYVAMLWASVSGICDIGSYTGTGSDLNVDCGFTNGARFVLIKRTDSNGDWYYWDTLRGIVTGNDPYLLLNSTAAQVTNTDYIDPLSSGFTVTSSAPAALNASGGEYIYMAIA